MSTQNQVITDLICVFPAEKSKSITIKIIEVIVSRITDIIFSIFGIILLLPITFGVLLCRLILKDRGPIFYKQKRIGKNGKTFELYKFRTMIVDADKDLDKILSENYKIKKEYERYKKIKHDPRITNIGRFLRMTSLDEFPQFINVLKGDMSIVGPRPYIEAEKKDMGIYYQSIIQCKPGLTGVWQISGRNNIPFEDRLVLETKYVKEKSMLNDMRIIFKTITDLNRIIVDKKNRG